MGLHPTTMKNIFDGFIAKRNMNRVIECIEIRQRRQDLVFPVKEDIVGHVPFPLDAYVT